MFKQCNIVMLPTNNVSSIGMYADTKRLVHNIPYKDIPRGMYQHLYITSDDNIERGDWCINKNQDTLYRVTISGGTDDWSKVIASTDSTLNLPQLSTTFITTYIEEYNKGNVIKDCMMEYVEVYDWSLEEDAIKFPIGDKPKINPKDNTITIKTVKDSWSREEVITIHKANCERLTNSYLSSDLDWIKEQMNL